MVRWMWFCAMAVVLGSGCSTLIAPKEAWGLAPDQIVLTFDDGPNGRGDVTARVLDVLKAHGIRGTFCVVGQEVEKYPDLVRRIVSEGHRLVNHSYSHPMPLFLSSTEWESELDRCDRAVGAALGDPGYRSSGFRPPYLLSGASVDRVASLRRLQPVGVSVFSVLTVDSEFCPDNGGQVLKFYEESLERDRGGVIVFHDGVFRGRPVPDAETQRTDRETNRSWVPGALEELIGYFSARGYTFVPLAGSRT